MGLPLSGPVSITAEKDSGTPYPVQFSTQIAQPFILLSVQRVFRSIGGYKNFETNSWTWVASETAIENFDWAENQPDSEIAGAAIALSCENQYQWVSIETPFDHEAAYICEYAR